MDVMKEQVIKGSVGAEPVFTSRRHVHLLQQRRSKSQKRKKASSRCMFSERCYDRWGGGGSFYLFQDYQP